jgi:tetratricopeptide (TPR) repeat protein
LSDAEAAFEKADELTNHRDIRVKNAQFTFYQAIGDLDRAERIIQELQASPGMDDAIRYLSMAHMHLILEHEESAIECFTEAVRFGADPVELGNRVAQLWLNASKPNRAIEELERVLERVPSDAPSRRRLAALLASRGTASDWTRVDELLSATRPENTPDDVRLQVLLLSRKENATDLAKAQYLLELIVEDPANRTDEDRFQLASLYLRSEALQLKANGESSETRQLAEAAGRLLKMACNGPKANPNYVYTYADFLLKQDRYYDALEEFERLKNLAPDSFTSILLKARLELANGLPEIAKETIMVWMRSQLEPNPKDGDSAKRAVPMVQAGQALMALKMPKEAEALLREAYRWDPRTAKDYVRNLLSTDDVVVRKMAIDFLVERVKNEKTSEFATVLAGVLKSVESDTRFAASTQEAISQIDTASITDPQLLKSLADHWIWQGKDLSAIETFRRIIELRPNDIVALNNLANLLAEQPNGTQEALQHIERAIAIAGENPVLLDTKGTVLLLGSRFLEAVQVLRLAESKEPSDPRILLHLYSALKGVLNSNDRGSIRDADVAAVANRIDLELLKKYPLTRGDQTEVDRLAKSRGK